MGGATPLQMGEPVIEAFLTRLANPRERSSLSVGR